MSLTDEKNKNTEYIQVPKDDLHRALGILSEFTSLLKTEVQEKQNILLMASSYEDLGTAYGLLAACDPELNAGLAVTSQETRARLRQAYSHVDAVLPNTKDGSMAQAACMQLEAALFSILNMCYGQGTAAQGALENTMVAAGFGKDLINGLQEVGPDALSDGYMALDGQRLTDERLGMLAALFQDLLPQAMPDGAGDSSGKEDAGCQGST